MPKLISFKYQKGAGDVTNRVAFVITKPSQNYSMLEVSDDSEFEITEIEEAMKQEYDRHTKALKELEAKFGLKYKNFTGTNVFDVEEL